MSPTLRSKPRQAPVLDLPQGDGRSVGFSSVSVSSVFETRHDDVFGVQVHRIRRQLRAVHGSLKERILEEARTRQEQIPKLTEIIRGSHQ